MTSTLAASRARIARDVRSYPVRKALRAAVVVPACFAVGSELIGDAQLATFAAFGAFALLLFVEFGGGRSARFAAYLLLGLTGAVTITLGSLVSRPDWLAVVAMGVVAFLILFAGSVSSTIAAAGRAALLTFILPVMLPGGTAAIPARLAGWGIALAVAVPVALFVWPPQEQNQLRVRAGDMCRALGRRLALSPPSNGGDPRVVLSRALKDLRAAFRASAVRPVALSTGSRLLMRLVDEMEWLATAVENACEDAPEVWPEQGRRLRAAAAEALHAAGFVLDHDGDGPSEPHCHDLDRAILDLDDARRAVSEEALVELRAAARTGVTPGLGTLVADAGEVAGGEFDRPLYAAHELGYVVALTARTVAVIAAADSRGFLARLLGRRPVGVTPGEYGFMDVGEAVAAQRLAVGHLDRHSVWMQNSLRGAAGLAVAVLIARLSGQLEGFWIVLGALSVLRSNALSTSATALRALAGTAVGFAVGALLVGLIGTSPALLWPLLPVTIFIAGFAPELISFAAGQAAFTLMVIILFNIIAPAGWKIGILRIEDVALGCLASLVAGALFWPRGAGAALGTVLAESYRAGAANLRQAVDFMTGARDTAPDTLAAAYASTTRVDDALRQYLAERGAKNVPLASLTTLANGATRLRLAGVAVTGLALAGPASPDLDGPVTLLRQVTDDVSGWYRSLGDALVPGGAPPPDVVASPPGTFLEAVVPAVDRCGDPQRAEQAERLLWSGQYVGDVNRLRAELLAPTEQVRQTRGRPWWRR